MPASVAVVAGADVYSRDGLETGAAVDAADDERESDEDWTASFDRASRAAHWERRPY